MENSDYRIDLSKYRIEKAKENIAAAEILLKNKLYAESINRAYYSIFHCVRGLLAYDEFDSRKHSGIISFFNQNYIKINKIEKDYSVIITNAFTIRSKSDYDDFYIVSKEDAEEQLENAKIFFKRILKYLEDNF